MSGSGNRTVNVFMTESVLLSCRSRKTLARAGPTTSVNKVREFDERRYGVELEVELRNGNSYSEKVLHAKGSDKHPMTEEEVLQKFALLASRVLSSPRVDKLRDTLLNLEKLDDARKIGKLLTA